MYVWNREVCEVIWQDEVTPLPRFGFWPTILVKKMCVCVIYVCILIDRQRASFGNKNSDSLAQAGVLPRLLGKVAMLWARERERWRKRKKRQDLAQLSQLGFFCLLSQLELQERNPSWNKKLRSFWFSKC